VRLRHLAFLRDRYQCGEGITMTLRSDLLAMMDEILRRQATGQVFQQLGSAMLSLVAFGRVLVGTSIRPPPTWHQINMTRQN
jgi:hypothetical protein